MWAREGAYQLSHHINFPSLPLPSFQHAHTCIWFIPPYAICTRREVILGYFVYSQSLFYPTHYTQVLLPQKLPSGWNGINQHRQERPEPKVLLSNPKWSDSLNISAFWPILFKLLNDTLISDEQGGEISGLLLTPQCDKPGRLHIGRGHTWVILCFQPVV